MLHRFSRRLLTLLSLLVLAALFFGCDANKQPSEPGGQIHITGTAVVNAPLFRGKFFGNEIGYFISGGDGTLLRSADGITWEKADTTGVSEAIFDFALNPETNTLIAVGTQARILKSVDGGQHWNRLESSSDYALTRVAYNDINKCWLTAGEAGLVLMSCDDGASWQFIDGLPQQNFVSLVAYETAWLLGGEGGVWRSNDLLADNLHANTDAANWQHIYATEDNNSVTGIYTLAQQNQLLVTFSDATIAINANEEWTRTRHRLAPEPVWLTAVAANTTQIVITGGDGSVFVSNDAGRRWQQQHVTNHYLSSALWLPAKQQFVVVGNAGSAAVSSGKNESWDTIDLSVDGNFEGLLALENGHTFAAFGSGGQFVIQNLGKNQLSVLQQNLEGYVQDLLLLPEGRLVAAGSEGFLYYSDDAGVRWQRPESDITRDDYLLSLVYLPQEKVVLASGPTGSIFRSTDAGSSWRRMLEADATAGYFHKLLFDPNRKQVLALASPGYTRVSRDAGETWAATIEDFGDHLLNVAQNPESGRYIAVGRKGSIQISDDGLAWRRRPLKAPVDLYAVYYHSPSKRWFAAGSGGVIWTSGDDGERWHASEGDPAQTLFHISGVDKAVLVATGSNGLLLVSHNAGDEWALIDTQLGENLREPFVSSEQHILIPGKEGSLLLSEDKGESWSVIPTGTSKSLKLVRQISHTGSVVAAGERMVRLPLRYNQ